MMWPVRWNIGSRGTRRVSASVPGVTAIGRDRFAMRLSRGAAITTLVTVCPRTSRVRTVRGGIDRCRRASGVCSHVWRLYGTRCVLLHS